jgi:AcrR family transcriptional regulator
VAVAEEAGVSPETVYLSLGGKRGLLEGAIEMAIAGAEDGVAQEGRWWATVAELPGAPERLEKMVEYSCRILARTRPLHAVIRGAADKEASAAVLGHRLLQDRLTAQTERIREYLADDLRSGLSIEQAGSAIACSQARSSITSSRLSPAGRPISTGRGSPTCSRPNC